jgi:1,2-phenylacetyl-CoA epoxidase PaaB subunit
LQKPTKDDFHLYRPEVIQRVLPKIRDRAKLTALKRREPTLSQFITKASRIITESADLDDELVEKVQLRVESAMYQGVLLSELVRREQEIADLQEIMSRSGKEEDTKE